MGRVKTPETLLKTETDNSTKILAVLGSLNQKLDALETRITQHEQKVNEKLDFILSEILDIAQGKKPITVNINYDPTHMEQRQEKEEDEDQDEGEETETETEDSGTIEFQPIEEEEEEEEEEEDMEPITYKLNTQIETVPELWKEWHLGLNGGPAIDHLNKKDKYWYGDDKVLYHRRLRVIQAIKLYAKKRGIPERTAMRLAEDIRIKQKTDLYNFGHHRRNIFI